MCEFFGDGGRQIVGKRCVWESCVWESCLWEGHACHAKWHWMSPSATPATQTAANGVKPDPSVPPEPAQCHTKWRSMSTNATPATQSEVDVTKCHFCHTKWTSMRCHQVPHLARQNNAGCRQVPHLPHKQRRRPRHQTGPARSLWGRRDSPMFSNRDHFRGRQQIPQDLNYPMGDHQKQHLEQISGTCFSKGGC